MNARFTLDGGDDLENRLDQTCAAVADAIRGAVPSDKLEAILLGGGYGRGEGGVLKTAAADLPYNDLEFYVCLRGHPWLNERRYGARLHRLAESLSPAAQVEIEFKITSLDRLRRSPVSMFSYDLLMGHRWLVGNEQLLHGCDHHRDPSRIPLAEASRLLMNRCSGLLFSRERLERDPFSCEDADFIGRNLAKAQLGFGDAVLAARGRYHWSCRERYRRLEKFFSEDDLPWVYDIQREHIAGMEFKLHPRRSTHARSILLEDWERLAALGKQVWLWIEERRLERSFDSPHHYVFDPRPKFPESPAWWNLLVTAKSLGLGKCLSREARHSPRERLFRALPILLWEQRSLNDPAVNALLRKNLGANSRDFIGWVRLYERAWKKFQ